MQRVATPSVCLLVVASAAALVVAGFASAETVEKPNPARVASLGVLNYGDLAHANTERNAEAPAPATAAFKRASVPHPIPQLLSPVVD